MMIRTKTIRMIMVMRRMMLRTCGAQTAAFTKDFLDRMATPLAQGHCHDYQVKMTMVKKMMMSGDTFLLQVGSPLCEVGTDDAPLHLSGVPQPNCLSFISILLSSLLHLIHKDTFV